MRHAVSVVLTAVAAALLLFSAAVLHGLASEYGADVFPDGSWVIVLLVPAGLAVLCLLGARAPVGRRRLRTSVLAVGVVGLFAATGAAAIALGDRGHERDRRAQASACSAGDVAQLTAVDAPGAHSGPAGDADGGCSVVVSWVPDLDRAQAAVTESLERGGWQRTARGGDEQVFQRDGATLVLTAVSDGKATDVRLTLR